MKPSSIQLPGQAQFSCENPSYGEAVLASMEKGNITHIRDDGQALIIGLPENWGGLSAEERKATVHFATCYAKNQNRRLQYRIIGR